MKRQALHILGKNFNYAESHSIESMLLWEEEKNNQKKNIIKIYLFKNNSAKFLDSQTCAVYFMFMSKFYLTFFLLTELTLQRR